MIRLCCYCIILVVLLQHDQNDVFAWVFAWVFACACVMGDAQLEAAPSCCKYVGVNVC